MRELNIIIGWVVGSICILLAFSLVADGSLKVSMAFLAFGIVLIPPVREELLERLPHPILISMWVWIPAMFVMLANMEATPQAPSAPISDFERMQETPKPVVRKKKEKSIEQEKYGAVVHCQNIIRQRLKSPGSAKFPAVSKDIFINGNQVTVTSYVDSQNGFGAILRTNYICKLKYDGQDDAWSLVDFYND